MNPHPIYYKTIEVDSLNIFYREAGPQHAPVILLMHGFPSSSFMYRNLIEKLKDRYHLIAPDYPGFGYSSFPDADHFEYQLLYDYQNNIKEYPNWQKMLREKQSPTLVVWGENDVFFTKEGALAYGQDIDNKYRI